MKYVNVWDFNQKKTGKCKSLQNQFKSFKQLQDLYLPNV